MKKKRYSMSGKKTFKTIWIITPPPLHLRKNRQGKLRCLGYFYLTFL